MGAGSFCRAHSAARVIGASHNASRITANCATIRLKAFAVRAGDLFSRVGGEEFACLIPNVLMEEALQIVERLRAAFGLMRFPGATPL